MIFYKVEAFTQDKERACLNFICIHCLFPCVNDGYDINIKGTLYDPKDKAYWCDNCGVDNGHPKYKEAMAKNLIKKGEIDL